MKDKPTDSDEASSSAQAAPLEMLARFQSTLGFGKPPRPTNNIVDNQNQNQNQDQNNINIPRPQEQQLQQLARPPLPPPPQSTSPPVPLETVVVSYPNNHAERGPPPPEDSHRAVHRIRLAALDHNYACVESAANRQRCSVIVVVKADGYGHGAVATALHLADSCGCDAFAVATLEEGVALRRAFENNPPGRWNRNLAALFHTQDVGLMNMNEGPSSGVNSVTATPAGHCPCNDNGTVPTANETRSNSIVSNFSGPARTMRPGKIRILVLGPPVGFPRCFDDYFHHGIEVMVSGPEVARALVEWVVNEKERKRQQAERAAAQTKAEALSSAQNVPWDAPTTGAGGAAGGCCGTAAAGGGAAAGGAPGVEAKNENGSGDPPKPPKLAASTLNAVQGQDLVREVRAILMNQNKVTAEANSQQQQQQANPQKMISPVASAGSSVSSNELNSNNAHQSAPAAMNQQPAPPKSAQAFGGIEAAAKTSRQRQFAAARADEVFREDSSESSLPLGAIASGTATSTIVPGPVRKFLRWHALVDSGMGRLGFRTEAVKRGEDRMDTVDVIQELVDAEIHGNAPIEFVGMQTHMAEANDTSDYTHQQIAKFVDLLKRVRAAGIFVPSVSTDNSAALLTTNLTHFDPNEILLQSHTDTRGYVRTGGAIYGQRPAFKQLRAVSTLMASVRHVAVLKKGESVGYDRAYTAPYDVRIATLTIGFADGYPRDLGGIGKVAIRGAVFPVAGNVCMDMMMVELGPAEDKAGIGATVTVGDTAVLWGPLDEDDDDDEGLVRLRDIAATLKTTQSALTCGLDKIRVRRQFV